MQEEYIDLEMYENKYYTQESGSDGEGLFAFTEVDDNELKG